MKQLKINTALILHIISIVITFESLFILLTVLVSFIYKEQVFSDLIYTFLITFILGVVLNLITKKQRQVEPSLRESFIIVTLAWVVMALVGTLPYLLTGSIPNFTNAFFESISGFTTTGSSILADIEALPKSVLFWRAETHWIGGMGIIVLVVAIMPFLKINGIYLFYSEVSSVATEKVSTRIRKVARRLWLIYMGLTFAETIILWIGGMSLFDAICHSFATIATGGFSTKNDSLASFSPFIQYTVTFFMLLSGINFVVHVFWLRGDFKTAFKNEELRLYLKIILVAGTIITLSLFFHHQDMGFEPAFRHAFFQVISIITATGFATADYLQWPLQSIGIIAILMLIGASSGSTGGGVKVIRHLVVFKRIRTLYKEYFSSSTVVRVVHYNKNVVRPELINRVFTFVLFYYLIVIIGTMIMMLWTNDLKTSFGAVATSMAGIGPGFGTVGPVSNFLHLPDGAKYFLTALMVIGRLEIYSVLVLFTPSFWLD
ncbi:TrkH family potassium uptake protein [uncultured Draconibacterium sp.]|uniref:TrkH family potassium uptake protein n=1 Tax=uncultured Draconibacterium sp. TaxID=1573823 RepID=UPI002AA5F47F|nr:TrkH family potassium uptake protein [uncultured Draconibacterium sp.]